MLMELGYASSTTTAAVDIFHSRGTYPWPPKYGTNESGSLAIALEWLAPLCAREKPWTIGKDSPLDNEGDSHRCIATATVLWLSFRPRRSSLCAALPGRGAGVPCQPHAVPRGGFEGQGRCRRRDLLRIYLYDLGRFDMAN